MTWQRAHWYVGTTALIAFIVTGAYMRWIAHVPQMSDTVRAMYRSRHLFVMLSALGNLALATARFEGWVRKLVSIPLLIVPWLLLVAFFVEPEQPFEVRHYWAAAGLYLAFGVTAVLVVANRLQGKE